MADVIASLAVKLEAVGAEQAKRQVAGLGQEMGKAETAGARLRDGFSSLRGVLATLGVGLVARELQQLADTATRVRSQLSLVTQGTGELAQTMGVVRDIALGARAPLEATASLYTRIAQASGDLGISQRDVATITQTVAQSLAVSGTNATTAAGSLMQLGQALGGGVVRAEEFNSILEGNAALVQAVARAAGTSVAGLRKAVVDGALSSEEFAQLIIKATGEIGASFTRMDATMAQGATNIRTSLTLIVGEMDKVVGASATIGRALGGVADFIRSDGAFYVGAIGMAVALGGVAAALYAIVPAAGAALAALAPLLAAGGWIGVLVGALGIGAGAAISLGIAGQMAEQSAEEARQEAAQQAQVDAIVQRVRTRNGGAQGSGATAFPGLSSGGRSNQAAAPAAYRARMMRDKRGNPIISTSSAGPMDAFARQIAAQSQAGQVDRAAGTKSQIGSLLALSQGGGILDGIRGPRNGAKGVDELLSAGEEVRRQIADMAQMIEQGLAGSISNAISSGFARAAQATSFADGFKALGSAFLGGLGGMLQQIGTQGLIASKLLAGLAKSLASGGFGGVAASLALIAFGGVLQGLAGRTTSQRSVPVGAGAGASGSTGGTIIDRGIIGGPIAPFGGTSFGAPGMPGGVSVGNLVLLSPNDPTWQRQLSESLRGVRTREG